jgi:hypothetical protein
MVSRDVFFTRPVPLVNSVTIQQHPTSIKAHCHECAHVNPMDPSKIHRRSLNLAGGVQPVRLRLSARSVSHSAVFFSQKNQLDFSRSEQAGHLGPELIK